MSDAFLAQCIPKDVKPGLKKVSEQRIHSRKVHTICLTPHGLFQDSLGVVPAKPRAEADVGDGAAAGGEKVAEIGQGAGGGEARGGTRHITRSEQQGIRNAAENGIQAR